MRWVSILKRFLGLPRKLSSLESAILGSVGRELRESEARLWYAQVAAINTVHRSPDGKEVNFWAIRRGRVDWPKELCFELPEEFKIAVVDVTSSCGALKLRSRVWCVHGRLFSIEYKTSFEAFEALAQGGWSVQCHIESYPVRRG
jgi:hypothetical protein